MVKMSMNRSLVTLLKSRLAPRPPGPKPAPDQVPAGVLVPLLYEDGDEALLLFTQRAYTVKDHRGQISFPGGVRAPGDPDLLATALRETQEEIGLNPQVVELLGALTPVATTTGYHITPFLGLIAPADGKNGKPERYQFHPNPQEVKRLLFLPLKGFFDPACWSSWIYRNQGQSTRVWEWRCRGELIWGATASILLNLLDLLDLNPIPGEDYAIHLD